MSPAGEMVVDEKERLVSMQKYTILLTGLRSGWKAMLKKWMKIGKYLIRSHTNYHIHIKLNHIGTLSPVTSITPPNTHGRSRWIQFRHASIIFSFSRNSESQKILQNTFALALHWR